MSAEPFNRRLVIGIGAFGVLSFLAGVVFSIFGPAAPNRDSFEADTFSRSALGHSGLLALLRALDVPVVVSRSRTAEKAGEDTVLVILEPAVDRETASDLREMVRAARGGVVLVLPKWSGERDLLNPAWVRGARWLGAEAAVDVLDALYVDVSAALAAPGPWLRAERAATLPDPSLPRPQLVTGPALDPLLSTAEGVLAAFVSFEGRDVLVISDPDLLNNAGLHQGQNGPLVVGLLALFADRGSVIIDETLHGYTAPPSVFRHLFEFPLVLALAQALLVVALLLWAGMRRFGAPTPAPVGLGRGRAVLLENTATLLEFGGHSAAALRRYWDDAVRDVREALHAPHDLRGEALHGWLDRVAAARGVAVASRALHDQVRHAAEPRATPHARLIAARAVHAWRAGITASPGTGEP